MRCRLAREPRMCARRREDQGAENLPFAMADGNARRSMRVD